MSTEKSLSQLNQQEDELEPLLSDLRRLVAEARHRALRAVDVIQVQTYWQVVAISWSLSRTARNEQRTVSACFLLWQTG